MPVIEPGLRVPAALWKSHLPGVPILTFYQRLVFVLLKVLRFFKLSKKRGFHLLLKFFHCFYHGFLVQKLVDVDRFALRIVILDKYGYRFVLPK